MDGHQHQHRKKTQCAGIVVYREVAASAGGAREFLLLKSSAKGHWGFPKGHVEAGETLLAAAKRETQEEAGLDADTQLELDQEFQTSIRYNVTTRKGRKEDKTVTFWMGKLKEEANKDGKDVVKLSKEHVDFCWLPEKAAREKLASHPNLVTVLDKCAQRLSEKQQ